MVAMVVGSTIGGYVPTFFGSDMFSLSSIIGSFLGGILGIWLVYKFLNS
jgi:uncharacterized membrane protein YeaQ/YmgE (transglycosylase-associated protein family)